MFRTRVMGMAARGVRYNSTNAYVSKASGFAKSISQKTVGFFNCATYWSKVVAELGKQVYVKEGYAPPSIAEFQTVYKQLFELAKTQFNKYSENPKALVDVYNAITRQHVLKYGAIGVQFAGLFALGEIIGRRHIVDYPHH